MTTNLLDICRDQCGSKCCRSPMASHLPLQRRERHLFDGEELVREIKVLDKRGLPMTRRGTFVKFNGQCPKLADDGSCSIYEQRPVTCRKFPTQAVRGCLLWPT